MAFPHDGVKFEPGVSGNPAGNHKRTKHLSTWIQDLLNDEEFEAQILEGYKIVDFKGAPIKAIIKAQMIKALNGDVKAFESLAKFGYGTKTEVENSGEQKLIIETRKATKKQTKDVDEDD
jgi:hypothetical protein